MNIFNSSAKDVGPWYRQPWPWILMSGPFMVVVASIISAWVALSSSDGLVIDDYYPKGLAASQTIAMSDKAKILGLEANVTVVERSIQVVLKSKNDEYIFPEVVIVKLAHPTRAGMDSTLKLSRSSEGYKSEYRLPRAGHWVISIEDKNETWRLLGNVMLPASGPIIIGGVTATDSYHR